MGKPLPSSSFSTKLQEFARLVSAEKLEGAKREASVFRATGVCPPDTPKSRRVRVDSERPNLKMENSAGQTRLPLSEVVSDCVRRWFQDTLKEAKAGDSAMQVLVGQMYSSGYGIPRDPQKGRAWMTRASKSRSSVWKVSDKHPGYNASDSDSDELKVDAK
ncbi:uncharacterized protein LOC131166472 [Malania oleifera]|uniref:uncharacterized protein LOC131166472 n=1 Tax=Malania oleifera TaxID=397392 RepID=UPI0025ADD7B0|nr:uncharacterized protein LOC131166472 [Malania oleifera]